MAIDMAKSEKEQSDWILVISVIVRNYRYLDPKGRCFSNVL